MFFDHLRAVQQDKFYDKLKLASKAPKIVTKLKSILDTTWFKLYSILENRRPIFCILLAL